MIQIRGGTQVFYPTPGEVRTPVFLGPFAKLDYTMIPASFALAFPGADQVSPTKA